LREKFLLFKGFLLTCGKHKRLRSFYFLAFSVRETEKGKKAADEIDGKEDAWIDGRVFLAV